MKDVIPAVAALAIMACVAVSPAQPSNTDNATNTNPSFRCSVASNVTTVITRYRHWSHGGGFVDRTQSESNGLWRLTFQVVYTRPTGHPEEGEISWTIPGEVTTNRIVVIRMADGHGLKFKDHKEDREEAAED